MLDSKGPYGEEHKFMISKCVGVSLYKSNFSFPVPYILEYMGQQLNESLT